MGMNQMEVLNLVDSIRKYLSALACPVQALPVKGRQRHIRYED